jgi:asparagine synthetase B (glutamine-hydrolysing)
MSHRAINRRLPTPEGAEENDQLAAIDDEHQSGKYEKILFTRAFDGPFTSEEFEHARMHDERSSVSRRRPHFLPLRGARSCCSPMCGIGAVLLAAADPVTVGTAAACSRPATDGSSGSSSGGGSSVSAPSAAWSLPLEAERSSALWTSTLHNRGPDHQASTLLITEDKCAVAVAASVLHLRGPYASVTRQPLSDNSGNSLCWNGEIFGGAITVEADQNDTALLADALHAATDAVPTPADDASSASSAGYSSAIASCVLSVVTAVEGPFAFIFFHRSSRTLIYGRDKLGRRSLVLASTQLAGGSQALLIGSVALPQFEFAAAPFEWEEVATSGIFAVHLPVHRTSDASAPLARLHYAWPHVLRAVSDLAPVADASQVRVQVMPFARTAAVASADDDASDEDDENSAPERKHAMDNKIPSAAASSAAAGSRDGSSLSDADASVAMSSAPRPRPLAVDDSAVTAFLNTLSESVRVRISTISFDPGVLRCGHARLGILFSGGVDCMLIAALAHRHLPEGEAIDLINVVFVGDLPASAAALHAPDRATAINGLEELHSVAPRRRWRLIQVNVRFEDLERCRARVLSLVQPRDSIMDFTIGSVLFFAARAVGAVHVSPPAAAAAAPTADDESKREAPIPSKHARYHDATAAASGEPKLSRAERAERKKAIRRDRREAARGPASRGNGSGLEFLPFPLPPSVRFISDELGSDSAKAEPESADGVAEACGAGYWSRSRVLLVGIGADEQLAGYARHRTTWRRFGTSGLQAELDKDVRRLWRRNLGRDDRVVSDSGREPRHPFLDERFCELVAKLPIEQICDLTLPPGVGDKRILRLSAERVGLVRHSALLKRAMQFGARVSNNRVAGYVKMSADVNLMDVVNRHFLHPERLAAAGAAPIADALNKHKTRRPGVVTE